MDSIQVNLLNKIDILIKLSNDFDLGFKIIYNLEGDMLDKKNIETLYSMTKNYILMRKEHGEILLMINKFTNSINLNTQVNKLQDKKSNKNSSKTTDNNIDNSEITQLLYDLSTFNTLLGNVNDLINNIDYEYKKIALKYPKFINKKRITLILICQESDNKYIELINELEKSNPEHIYKIIKCENNKEDKQRCEEELKEFGIKIKSSPIIYIINDKILTEIPMSNDGIEAIKSMVK